MFLSPVLITGSVTAEHGAHQLQLVFTQGAPGFASRVQGLYGAGVQSLACMPEGQGLYLLSHLPNPVFWFLLGVFSSPWLWVLSWLLQQTFRSLSKVLSSTLASPVEGLVLRTGLSCQRSCPLRWPLRSCSHSALVGASLSKALFPFSARSVFSPEMSLMCVLSRSALSNFQMFGGFYLASIPSIRLLWSETVLCSLF